MKSISATSLLLFAFALLAALNLSGFCFSQMRYIDRKEFIELALTKRAAQIDGIPENHSIQDVRTYLREHPKCCRVQGGGFFLNSSFLDRILGFGVSWIRIVHVRRNASATPNEGIYSDMYVGLSDCGELIEITGHNFTHGPAEI